MFNMNIQAQKMVKQNIFRKISPKYYKRKYFIIYQNTCSFKYLHFSLSDVSEKLNNQLKSIKNNMELILKQVR